MSAARKGRRRKPAATARLRPFWLLMLAFAIVMTAGGYVAIGLPLFQPRVIRATGTNVVSPADVIARAAIDRRQNMWLQNSAAIEKRVEAIPYVGAVHVERSWPNVETLAIVERTPYAIVTSAKETYLVDRALRVLSIGRGAAKLPELRATISTPLDAGAFLADPGLAALRDDNEALLGAHLVARSLAHDKYGDLVVVLGNGIRVLFGDESDLAKKIPLVDPILTQVGKAGRPIATIDLRALGTPVVVYKK